MKKVKEYWLDYKSSINWIMVLFWGGIFNLYALSISSVEKFLLVNLLLFIMTLFSWYYHRQARKLNSEKVKTAEPITLELPTFKSWSDVLELYDDVHSAKQLTNALSKDYPAGLKIKSTKYNLK